MSHDRSSVPPTLINEIRQVIDQARGRVQQAVNASMVQAYWHIGRLIVEQEQRGAARAEYGKQQLEQLSRTLQAEFGKGFDVSNLRNMRRFYLAYPKQDAVRPELSWTHYRRLIHIENPQARAWYTRETIEQNWSASSASAPRACVRLLFSLSPRERAGVREKHWINRHDTF